MIITYCIKIYFLTNTAPLKGTIVNRGGPSLNQRLLKISLESLSGELLENSSTFSQLKMSDFFKGYLEIVKIYFRNEVSYKKIQIVIDVHVHK